MTRRRKRRLLLSIRPEHGLVTREFFAAVEAHGAAKAEWKLTRTFKANVEYVAAGDKLIRMRWWEHVTPRPIAKVITP